eukprot:13504448-Alexandrium_andersonii.AAC.1
MRTASVVPVGGVQGRRNPPSEERVTWGGTPSWERRKACRRPHEAVLHKCSYAKARGLPKVAFAK